MKNLRTIIHPIIVTLLVAAMLVPGISISAQDESGIDPSFSMNAQYVNAGDTFNAPVNFGTNEPVQSVQFDFTYDPSVVHVVSVSAGTFLSDFATANGGTTTFTPGTIDNVTGKVSGIEMGLNGLPGMGAIGFGSAIVINYQAMNVHAKSQTTIVNYHVFSAGGGDLASLTNQAGGLVQVGPGPLLSVDGIHFTATGQGQSFGKTFKAQFTVHNTDGITSDATTATVIANGASPIVQKVNIPAVQPDTSVTIDLPAEYAVPDSATPGWVTEITVMVAGDGSLTKVYTYQPITDIKNTDVDGNVWPFIQITTPNLVQWPDLQIGPNTSSGIVNVKSNSNFKVDVYDQNPTTSWHMTEWNGIVFLGGHRLNDPLHILSPDQGTDVTFGNNANLITGSVNDQSPDAGKDYSVSFQQLRHSCDAALLGGRSYHLIVTLNGYIVF